MTELELIDEMHKMTWGAGADVFGSGTVIRSVHKLAKTEIERPLLAENKRLREALEDCVSLLDGGISGPVQHSGIYLEALRALKGESDEN